MRLKGGGFVNSKHENDVFKVTPIFLWAVVVNATTPIILFELGTQCYLTAGVWSEYL